MKSAANAWIPFLLLLSAALFPARPAAAETLQLPATPAYLRAVGRSLVVVGTDKTVQVIAGGRILSSIGPLPDLVGVDAADVTGDGAEDLVLVLKNGVEVADLSSLDVRGRRYADLETLYSRFDIANAPRSVRLFAARDGEGKAYPAWFAEEGLYARKDGRTRLISKESPRALINLLTTQVAMPGEDTVSLGFPRPVAFDLDGDGVAEIAYLHAGTVKIARMDRGEVGEIDVGDYTSDFPGILWQPAAFSFAARADGTAVLVLLSLQLDPSHLTSAKLLASFFAVPADLGGRRVSPVPLKRQVVDDIPLSNGSCSFDDFGGGKPGMVVRMVDIVGTMSDLMVHRSVTCVFQAYRLDAQALSFSKVAGQIRFAMSVDGLLGDRDRTASVPSLVASTDFADMLGSTFLRTLDEAGKSVVAVTNLQTREVLVYEADGSRLLRRLSVPREVRLTDRTTLIATPQGFELYSLRGRALGRFLLKGAR
jgi:hypothetical protein